MSGDHPRSRTLRESTFRKIVVDAGAAASRRHAMPAWFEADVTELLDVLHETRVSVTAYVIATLAQTVADHPHVHGYRDLRGRVVLFEDVDVNVSVEVALDGESFPMNHVLRGAQARPVADLDAEVHAVAAEPRRSDTAHLATSMRAYLLLPSAIRSRLLGSLRRLPEPQKRLAGTVGVTSVGMHAGGGGLGLPFLVHTLDLLVGGLEERPGFGADGAIERRSLLSLAVVADHDVVDGAPFTRFLADLRRALEAGTALRP